jgi:branched-chain amino acid transport system substrate-binding protein
VRRTAPRRRSCWLKKKYEAQFGREHSATPDAFTILRSVRRAGSTDPARVRDAIEGLKGFAGTAGIFNFSPADHNGLDMGSFEMLTVKGGKFVLLKP